MRLLFSVTALGLAAQFGPGLAGPAMAETIPSAVKQTSEKTVATDVKTQQAVDAWAAEEKELLSRIDRHERALKRVAWERKKTADYLSTLENKMDELREKAHEMERINAELLPILDKGMERLAAVIEGDLPFEMTQRIAQAADASQALSDYDTNLLVKTRTLFDAVAREVDVGYSVDTEETEIQIEGRSTRVKLLKVGRVGLYALTMDGQKAYAWDAAKGAFIPAGDSVREIDEAVQIVERIRIIELTRLPMGRPAKRPETGDGRHD